MRGQGGVTMSAELAEIGLGIGALLLGILFARRLLRRLHSEAELLDRVFEANRERERMEQEPEYRPRDHAA
jgi:hypothetical protein